MLLVLEAPDPVSLSFPVSRRTLGRQREVESHSQSETLKGNLSSRLQSNMSTRNRIPTAIEPLLRVPPEASLTILTGTLGCSPAWLTSRLIGSALGHDSTSAAGDISDGDCSVVLVSWMRDLTFWKSEVRRAMVCKVFHCSRF